jgi:predicted dehydrogenase
MESANDFDSVLILTPPEEHSKAIVDFLNLGKRVFSEKPTVSAMSELDEIEKTPNTLVNNLRTTYNYSGYPMVRDLREKIQNNLFGKVLNIRIEMLQEGFIKLDKNGIPYKPQDWRLKDDEIPTISLDLGTHVLHLLYFLTGELLNNGISITKSEGHFSVYDKVEILGETSNGIATNLSWGKTSLGNQNGLKIELFGDKGSAHWIQNNPEELRLADVCGEVRVLTRGNPSCGVGNLPRYTRFKGGHPSGFIEAFANVYEDFIYFEAKDSFSHSNYGFDVSKKIFNCLNKIHSNWAYKF